MFTTKLSVDKHVENVLKRFKNEKEKNTKGFQIAKLYFEVNEFETAIRYLSGYLSQNERSPWGHKLLGQIYSKLDQFNKALASFKRSLELDDKQKDVLLSICEIYCKIGIDADRAKYWIERAERVFPNQDIIFRLQERACLQSTDSGIQQDDKEMENLLSSELTHRPKDVSLRIKLLRLYIKMCRAEEACEHAVSVEHTLAHMNELEWYQCLLDVYKFYAERENKGLDGPFYQNLLWAQCQNTLLCLEKSKPVDCASSLNKFDQSLQQVEKLKTSSIIWKTFLNEMKASYFFHAGTLLLKRVSLGHMSLTDCLGLVSACFIVSYSFPHLPEHVSWLFNAKESDKKTYKLLRDLASYRLSQTGHSLMKLCPTSNFEKWISSIKQQFCNEQAKVRLFGQLYLRKDVSNVKEKSFLMQSLNYAQFHLTVPNSDDLYDYDSLSSLFKYDLAHIIWLSLQNPNLIGKDNFALKLFANLQMSTKNIDNCAADSLNQLDLQAFLILVVNEIENKAKTGGASNPSPFSYPVILYDRICREEQSKWWITAHSLYANTSREHLGKMRSILQRGLECIRGVQPAYLHPSQTASLARIFEKQANLSKIQNEIEIYMQRSNHYWKLTLDGLENIEQHKNPPRQKYLLFDVIDSNLDDHEFALIQEEAQYFMSSSARKCGFFNEALEILENLTSVQAAYDQAQIYKKLAEETLDGRSRDELTENQHATYSSLLTKAQNSVLTAMDRVGTDKFHPLLEDLRSDFDELKLRLFNLEQSDFEWVDAAADLSESNHSAINSPPSKSTPAKMSTPKVNLSSTSKSNTNAGERKSTSVAFPSPERLDCQVRSLAMAQEDTRNCLKEQHESYIKHTNVLLDEVKKTQQIVLELQEQIKDLTLAQKESVAAAAKANESVNVPTTSSSASGPLPPQFSTPCRPQTMPPPPPPMMPPPHGIYPNPATPYRPELDFSHAPFPPHFYSMYPHQTPPPPPHLAAQYGYNPSFVPPQLLSQMQQNMASPVGQPRFNALISAVGNDVTKNGVEDSYSAEDYENGNHDESNIENWAQELYPASSQIKTSTVGQLFPKPTEQSSLINKSSTVSSQPFAVNAVSNAFPTQVNNIAQSLPAFSSPLAFPGTLSIAGDKVTPTTMFSGKDVAQNPKPNLNVNAETVTGDSLYKISPSNSLGNASFGTKYPITFTTVESKTPKSESSQFVFKFDVDKANMNTSNTSSTGQTPQKSPGRVSRNVSVDENTADDSYQGPDFEPIIPLPDEVKVKTGEEGESVLFVHRAKLLRFTEKQWKERGLGDIKILHEPSTFQCRVVMRREQILKVCANHRIEADMKIEYKIDNGKENLKVLTWRAWDFTDSTNEPLLEQFCCRFKHEEVAAEFKKQFELAVKISAGKKSQNVKAIPNSSLNLASGFGETFRPKPGSWNCESCLVNNAFDVTVCVACTSVKPGCEAPTASASTSTPVNLTLGKTGGFSFGGFTQPTPDSSTTSDNKTETPGLSFQFSSTPKTTFTTTTKQESSLSISSTAQTPSSTKSNLSEINSPLNSLTESTSPHPSPLSDIKVICRHRAKLYMASGAKWKELGIGACIIESNPSSNQCFFKMTDESTKKQIALQDLSKTSAIQPRVEGGSVSKKILTWQAIDSFHSTEKNTFCLKFVNEDTTQKFKEKFEEMRNSIKSEDISKPTSQTSLGGFTFSSKPLVTTDTKKSDPSKDKKSEVSQENKPKNPFVSFSFPTSGSPSFPKFNLSENSSKTDTAKDNKPDVPIFGSNTKMHGFGDVKTMSGKEAPSFTNTTPVSNKLNTSAKDTSKDETDLPESFEPGLDFKPIVPLPDLVDVQSGEENEERLFEKRAKLFRNDIETKQWKERGIGDIKILKHNDNLRFRIVMRREQILKLCANHLISPEMNLQPMSSSKQAWCWHALDYSDTEAKNELLAVRFKTENDAEQFKTVFTECVEKLKAARSDPTKASDQPASSNEVSSSTGDPVDKSPVSLKDKFKAKPGEWDCVACYVRNKKDVNKCVACATLRPGYEEVDSTSAAPAETTGFSMASGGGFSFKLPVSSDKPLSDAESVNISSTTGSESNTFKPLGSISSGFKFGESKDLFSTPVTSASSSKNAPFSFTPTSNLSTPQKSNQPAPFSFGTPTQSTFKFGTNEPFKFTGVTPVKSPKKSPVKSPFDAPPLDLTRSPGPKSPEMPDGNNSYYEEDSDHIYFEPVVPLPDKVEVKTGEEGEDVLFISRAKLYRFTDEQWKERGLGDVKILHDPATNINRIVMRREQVWKLCLNHRLTDSLKLSLMDSSKGTAFVWQAEDYSEGKLEHLQFALRFKTTELANEFKTVFENACSSNSSSAKPGSTALENFNFSLEETSASASNSPVITPAKFTHSGFSNLSPSNNKMRDASQKTSILESLLQGDAKTESISTSPGGDDEVTFLYEETPTDDQIARAAKYQLPRNFYLFENKKQTCPGCRGCQDSDEDSKEKVNEQSSAAAASQNKAQTNLFGSNNKNEANSNSIFSNNSVSGFSFAALAKNDSPGFLQSKPSENFQWAGAGTSIFSAKSPQSVNASAAPDADDDTGAEGGEGAEHDPHFEPVVPLPSLVEVRTGEEDETAVLVQRSKLYRYDSGQWKERGVGDVKILLHAARRRYRILFRRDQVHKVACNHLISVDLHLRAMSAAENAWCWTALDYTDAAQPQQQQFAIKFKNKEIALDFKNKFEECQKEIEAWQHNENTDRSESVPSEHVPTKPTEEKPNQDTVHVSSSTQPTTGSKVIEDEEDDSSSEEESPILFSKRCTLFTISNSPKVCGLGELQVLYDDDVNGARIQMKGDDGKVICSHIICREYRLQKNESKRFCEWTAKDFATDEPVRQCFRVQFSSKESTQEFAEVFASGIELAQESEISEGTDSIFPRELVFTKLENNS